MRLLITLLLLNFTLLLRGMVALPPLKKNPKTKKPNKKKQNQNNPKEGMKGKVARKSNCAP